MGLRGLLDFVIPAWSAGIQVYMDVSGGILANVDAGNTAIRAGVTKTSISFSVGERKIMKHFVMNSCFSFF